MTRSLARNITGKEDYEFGDVTRWLDAWGKEKVANFTNNKEGQYEVGDITKEVVRRIQSGEYRVEDVWLWCRILVSLGVGLTPVASVLPVRLLLQLVNMGLAQEASDRVLGALAEVLDARVKEALTGDPDYRVGDLTKRAVLKLIGKDEYEFGDLTKTLLQQQQSKTKNNIIVQKKNDESILLNKEAMAELDEWDQAFLTSLEEENETSGG